MAMFANLGRTLSLLQELRGKSQARVAREAGIGKSQLSKYENGKELPKLDSLEKVLNALEVGVLTTPADAKGTIHFTLTVAEDSIQQKAVVYDKMGIERELFTPIFAIARVTGWLAHWFEQLKENKLYRPDQIYAGEHNRPYVPIERR